MTSMRPNEGAGLQTDANSALTTEVRRSELKNWWKTKY
jgi:hypothetical protein